MTTTALFIQEYLPEYRLTLFNMLSTFSDITVAYDQTIGAEASLYHTHTPSFKTIDAPVRSKTRLRVQPSAIRLYRDYDVVVSPFASRDLTSWALRLKYMGNTDTKHVLWGHGTRARNTFKLLTSAGGATMSPDRALLGGGSRVVALYTKRECNQLQTRTLLHQRNVTFVSNALYTRDQIYVQPNASPDGFLYVGRLVRGKRLDLLLAAFAAALRDLPSTTQLRIVGDGPLRSDLQAQALSLGLFNNIEFMRGSFDVARLGELYSRSFAHVCPGSVGLNVVQSLGWGRPIITSIGEHHGPEVSALLETGFGALVPSGDVQAMASAIVAEAEQPRLVTASARRASDHIAKYYAIEYVADRWREIIR